ncbi:MAG: phage terminase large subunit family protein [Synergistaceae bacterium]|nr:phage terminase large subunit family protein [Synergistaceae bacterium]
MKFPNEIFSPPPDLTISQWADSYRRLPPEASSEPGNWNTSRAPYQRAMMDAICSSSCERVVMMTAAQIGKSELLLNVIGYYIDKEPSPILMLQPTLEMGESFSKDRLATMIRDTPALNGKIKDPRSRDSGNTLLHKTFPGGHITIAGANSPAGLASRPIRILLCDEVDRYPMSAGSEGDPLNLAMKRTANFWNRKIILVSTPTIMGISRIEKEYDASTREVWEVPCPKCGTYTPLEWENVMYEGKTQPVMICRKCGHEGSESDWKSNQPRGKWQAQNESRVRGFHVNALASPWVTWGEIVSQYEEARRNGNENVKVWTNTVLGRPYEEAAGTLEVEELEFHRDKYPSELPDEVLVLTAGIDTQDNRLECEILGHGLNGESYGIAYRVIYGNPGMPEVWNVLDELLLREWHYADGTSLKVSCACVDSGGHYTEEVYRYCRGRARRNVFAIIGRGTFGTPPVRVSKLERYRLRLFILGVSTLKGELFSRLQAERGAGGYCHFPDDPENYYRGYDRKYFAGLLSERMVIKRVHGNDRIEWEQRRKDVRNEPLDCRVYAMGAFAILNPDMKRRQAEKSGEKPAQKSVRKVSRGFVRRGMRL